MSKKLSLAGQQKIVPAYYEGQNSNGAPNHYETLESADALRKSGKAKTINRGKAILIRGARKFLEPHRESVKHTLKVVGQTQKKNPSKPGFPRWNCV